MIGVSFFSNYFQIGPTNLFCSRANRKLHPLTKRIQTGKAAQEVTTRHPTLWVLTTAVRLTSLLRTAVA